MLCLWFLSDSVRDKDISVSAYPNIAKWGVEYLIYVQPGYEYKFYIVAAKDQMRNIRVKLR